jgi:hypothetical protein
MEEPHAERQLEILRTDQRAEIPHERRGENEWTGVIWLGTFEYHTHIVNADRSGRAV